MTVLHGRIRTGYRPFLGVHPINPLDHRKKSLYGAIRDSASFRGGEFFTDWLELRKVRNSANLILQKRNKKEKTRLKGGFFVDWNLSGPAPSGLKHSDQFPEHGTNRAGSGCFSHCRGPFFNGKRTAQRAVLNIGPLGPCIRAGRPKRLQLQQLGIRQGRRFRTFRPRAFVIHGVLPLLFKVTDCTIPCPRGRGLQRGIGALKGFGDVEHLLCGHFQTPIC